MKLFIKNNFRLLALSLLFTSCGPNLPSVTGPSKNKETKPEAPTLMEVPVSFEYVGSQPSFALGNATAFTINMTGCVSGYTSTATEAAPNLNVYKYDQSCLAKLSSFVYGGITWIPKAGQGFTTWLAGDFATFQDQSNPLLVIRVVVAAQLASPISGTEPVSYTFAEISSGTTNVIPNSVVGDPHVLTVSGQSAPSFTIKTVAETGMTALGAGQFQFTLECTQMLTGTGATTTCKDVLFTDIKYKLVQDTYGSTLTLAQAAALFPTGQSSITIPGDIVAPGTSGTVFGGFKTPTGAGVLAGPNQMHNNPNMLLVLQAAGTSYLYFNVDVTQLTQP